MDVLESLPGGINGYAAESLFILQVSSPADDHLTGMEEHPIQNPPGSTNASFVFVSDQSKKNRFAIGNIFFERTGHRSCGQVRVSA